MVKNFGRLVEEVLAVKTEDEDLLWLQCGAHAGINVRVY